METILDDRWIQRLDDFLLPYKMDLSFFSRIDNENLKDHMQKVGVVFYERGLKCQE